MSKRFLKYPKIKNTCNEKSLMRIMKQYPDFFEQSFILLEKIDGANFQVFFDEENDDILYGKRSSFLDFLNDDFFDFQDTMSEYLSTLVEMKELVQKKYGEGNVRFFGELFGQGIQKRINYGDKKRFLIFDVLHDDRFLPWSEIVNLFKDYKDFFVSPISVIKNFEEHEIIDVEKLISADSPSKDLAEGFIIKPYEKIYYDKGYGGPIFFKKKSDKFIEKGKLQKPKTYTNKKLTGKVRELSIAFSELINENRVKSIYSQHGVIKEPKQIGEYIKLVINDAKEDFLEDYREDLKELDKKEAKIVFDVGDKILRILRKEL